MFPMQQIGMSLNPAAQQARQMPLQAGSMQAGSVVGVQQTNGLDITVLMNLMITMMIIVMMMKMMTGAFAGISS